MPQPAIIALPAEMRALPAGEFGLVMNDVRNIAADGSAAGAAAILSRAHARRRIA